ncbi:MAG: type II toxin-antitoxin system VapC family toxin [Gammaproteobacteria bacterium]|nr:type II toxin-antitoxin system VapC family toxin [Gammaproteobacteria bacterium]MDE0365732.1 type II toxin-antitoxin system VapC family toxin [Gammaproteobacteria bacterium]
MAIVFDSSALLAVAFNETGAERAVEALSDGILSAVNASEVVACLIDRGVPEASARGRLRDFDIPVRPFDETLALAAGSLRTTTRQQGLSLGDRACLALAMRERAPVITADRNWTRLLLDLEVRLIR